MLNHIEEFYHKQNPTHREILLLLRSLILGLDDHLNEQWKYGAPFFCYNKKMFCYFWIDKKTHAPYIGVVEGGRIDHPLLEKGNRKRMKVLRLNPEEDLPVEGIEEVLREALQYY